MAARAKKQDEAPEQSGAALPGSTTLAIAGVETTPEEQAAEAESLAAAEEAEEKAKRGSVEIEEVDELPASESKLPKKTGPSVWALRLKAVSETKSGRARIYSCSTVATTTGMAWRTRKALAAGKFNDVLGADAPERFKIVTHGLDIYAEHVRPDAS